MRRAAAVVVVSAGLITVGASQAGAFVPGPTPTHEQFVAQLDSVCQPFVGPVNGASDTYNRYFSQMVRSAKRVTHAHRSGNRKALRRSSRVFLRALRRTGESLNAFAQVQASLIDQINTLTPPAEGWVGAWMGHLRDEQSAAATAGIAILQFRIDPFFTAVRQAEIARNAAHQDISGVGLRVCSSLAVS